MAPIRKSHVDAEPVQLHAGENLMSDRQAGLAALHTEHFESLMRTAYWILGDHSLAEEIVQDAFVKLAQAWDRVDDLAAAPGYLRRIVINLSRSKIRRLATGRRKLDRVARLEAAGGIAEPSFAAIDEPLAAAIRSLPRRQRECVVLRFVHDLTVDSIAETLAISSGSVKTHLHRGLQKLNDELQEERS